MNAFAQSLRSLGPVRLAAMGGVGIAVLAFFIYLTTRMASPQMELLYGDLELADANQIVEQLKQQKVPYELRRDGSEIWVPQDRKLDMRVKMAEQALPGGGSVNLGYEVFDKSDVLGSTSFMQNVNLVRALEGELARTIRSIDRVRSARVHLVLAKRETFSREMQEPSASIILNMQGNARLSPSQVQGIQHLVAAAVPRLKPSRISIVDDKGNLLARGFDNDGQMLAATAEQMRLNQENRLARTVETMLERSLGVGRVRAEVSLEMDLDRVATTQEIYDPESQVVRSQVTVEENSRDENSDTPSVSVAQNLPDAMANTGAGGRSSSSQARTQETVNYEISKTVRNQVREMGVVKRLSVAVLVDGIHSTDGQGQQVYQPRTDEEMEQLAVLVRSAVGYDANRGDVVEVINMRFAPVEDVAAGDAADTIFGFDREFVEKIAANLGLSVVAILFLLLVLKPLVSRAVETMGAGGVPDGRKLLTDQSAPPALTGPSAVPVPGLALPDENELDELIDLDKVEGRVKASSIRKIGEIVEKHPEEALSIIRNWMYQES